MKLWVLSLGCPKNWTDTEEIVGTLEKYDKNFELTEDPKKADILLINTCAFIQPAVEESIDEILEAIEIKTKFPEKKIIVAGCLYQRYGKELVKELPEIDKFVGINELEQVIQYLLGVKVSRKTMQKLRKILTPPHIAYLKIAEGCSNWCSYCTIPLIRGNLKSREISDLVQEVEILAEKGVKELYIVAQDITSYGKDFGMEQGLLDLLRKIEKVKGIKWIRLMYAYPSGVSDELVELIANSEKIVKYIDIPFQHVNDKVLKTMERRYTRKFIENLIEKLRKKIPEITIRTTFIVGFPTEGRKEFKELCKFLKDFELDWVGFFKFYREEGTKAYSLGDISEEEKNERLQEVQEIQEKIYEKKQKNLIGKEFTLLVDKKSGELPGYVEARSYKSAYEIDGVVFLKGDFPSGTFLKARLKEPITPTDFIGEML